MADLTKPSERRFKPVRLADIPVEVRVKAAHQIAKDEAGGDERVELLTAALFPSSKTYWVAA